MGVGYILYSIDSMAAHSEIILIFKTDDWFIMGVQQSSWTTTTKITQVTSNDPSCSRRMISFPHRLRMHSSTHNLIHTTCSLYVHLRPLGPTAPGQNSGRPMEPPLEQAWQGHPFRNAIILSQAPSSSSTHELHFESTWG